MEHVARVDDLQLERVVRHDVRPRVPRVGIDESADEPQLSVDRDDLRRREILGKDLAEALRKRLLELRRGGSILVVAMGGQLLRLPRHELQATVLDVEAGPHPYVIELAGFAELDRIG